MFASRPFKNLIQGFALLVFLSSTGTNPLLAQTASDGCNYNNGSRYTSNTTCTYQTFDKPGGFDNDLEPTGCSASDDDDAFGWFTATSTSTTITYDPDDNHNAIMHLFSGACGSLTNLTCANANGNGGNETITYATTIGTNYLIRIQRLNSNSAMDGRICIWGVPPPPTNDDPCGATSLTVGTSCTTVNGTNVSATATAGIPAPGCASYSTADVWFSFVAPAVGSINIETAAGTLTDGGVAIYSATACAGTFTLISCDDSNGPGNMGLAQASGLTAGTTYYARVWGNGGATGSFTICAYALANDNPCTATVLTVGTSCSTVSGTNVNATTTTGPPAPGCASFSTADVWYSFEAPAIGSIALETTAGSLTNGGMALYSATACNGTYALLACDDDNGTGNMSLALYNGLAVGTTYYVRVWGNGGATGTFNICAYALPNDNPCGATSLTVGTGCTPVNSTNASATTTTGPPAPGCASFSSGDVWFSFVAPAGGAVNLETTAGTLTDGGMAIYSATACAGTYALIACDDNNGPGNMSALSRTGLTVGATYYVRVWGNGGATGTFSICAMLPVANDEPCGAVALTVNTTCSATNTSNSFATITGAGIPAPGCGSFSGGDVWYTFVAPANGIVSIETTANGLTNSDIALYSATACGGTFALIECDDTDGPGNMGGIYRTGLTPGQTYYIRVWGNAGTSGTFSICVVSLPNDNPCGAISLTVNGSCTSTATTNLYATATAGIPAPGCAGYSTGDVWYTVVAPTGTMTVETSANGLTDSGIAMYSATACGGTFSLITCDDNAGPGSMSEINPTGLTPGQTYYVRVWGNGGGTGTFGICAWAVIPPVNDNPCSAIALTLDASCSFASYSNANATNTAGIPVPGCGNYNGGDVWFSFVAPANGLATMRATAGTLTNASMALYSANACNGTYTLVACDNTSGPGNMPFLSMTTLEIVPGQTYYLRVWGNNGNTGSFNLCANTAATGSTCVYVLRMYDTQGDGWGGSNVSIQVGGGAAVNYTITNSDQETAYILVNAGQTVQLSYSAAGGNQGEIRYVLQLAQGPLYSDGPAPGTGLRYAATANCQSPSPLNSDCYGNAALCGGEQISANPSNTGLTAELNEHNRGCLGSNERQGYWYSFRASAGGTVAFTIAPSNTNNDYDFAVWGPFTSLACPPTTPPLRCNYSGTTGNTGLATTASNPSEPGGGSKWSTAMNVNVNEYYLLYVSNWTQSGLAFDLSWQLTNGASLNCTLLPVELLSFDGEAMENDIRLRWTTGSETNSASFVVERSTNGQDFTALGTVTAAGNTVSTSDYTFVDAQPAGGMNYYRLKQVDLDGASEYSPMIAVAFNRAISTSIPYPNPANDHIYLDVQLGVEDQVEFAIHDASGRLVRNERISYAMGNHRFQAPLSGMDAGSYELIVHSSSGDILHAGRFMVE